jgi:membrane fusion protein (multidrug efflux system)
VEKAQLLEAEARLERARKRIARYEGIKDSKALSPETLDDARMEYRQAEAAVSSLKAQIERKNIRAPFDGKLGIIRVNVGQVLIPGNELLALQALDPLRVYFSLPQRFLPELTKGAALSISTDAYPGEKFTGEITSIEPNVSETTRNILIQGTIPNSERKLRAGMFTEVTLTMPGSISRIVLPASSIQYAPYGDSVYVVEEMTDAKGNKYTGVLPKIVKVGERRGDLVAIESGLSQGEIVATSGVFKLRPRAAVQINNSLAPAQELNPTPGDS